MSNPAARDAVVLKNSLVLIVLTAASLAGGCTGGSGDKMPDPVANVDRIALFVPQKAIVNWDKDPELDGVVAQIMLFKDHGKGLKTVLVTGEVDLMLYEGAKPDKFSDAPEPFVSRTFTARELSRRVVGQYDALRGYAVRLEWPAAPKTTHVWLIARYRRPGGGEIYSSPAEQRMPAPPKRK